jgi:hypothetical protein
MKHLHWPHNDIGERFERDLPLRFFLEDGVCSPGCYAASEPSRAFDVARLDKEKWGTKVWKTPSAWRIGSVLQIYDGTRNMMIKRRLEKVSSIFLTPTAGRERLNLTSLSKTKDRPLSSNLTAKALPSSTLFANDTPSLNASWGGCWCWDGCWE